MQNAPVKGSEPEKRRPVLSKRKGNPIGNLLLLFGGGLSGQWQGWRLTTDHAASNYGQPVLVSPSGKAYGPGDIDRPEWSIGKEKFSQADLAGALGVSRVRVGELLGQSKLPPFDGHLPNGRGWWSFDTMQEIVDKRKKEPADQ